MSQQRSSQRFTFADNLITQFDRALRTLTGNYPPSSRPDPAQGLPMAELTKKEQRHAAGLMRVNHVGEVCAQALYQGQALTARQPDIRAKLEHASQEEFDHLHWCLTRLQELESHPSYLNLFWYLGALTMGLIAGLAGDRWSLGFVAETENQVESHLESHLSKLPTVDHKSHAVLQQMKTDEAAHADMAMTAGGAELPLFIRAMMGCLASVMKTVAYRL